MSAPETTDFTEARIIDRGYRSYDGPRTGVRGAITTVIRHSVQRALGLRRTVWAKVLPLAAVLIAYLPAVVFIGVVALFPKQRRSSEFLLPTYGDYYGFIIAAIMVFVALVAPEVLCTDRRSGMLGVYLASPLDRTTYLVAKAAAIASVLSLVCLGPPLLLLVANVLQSQGPEGLSATLTTLGHVLVAGLALTALFTGLTMGIASFTDRKSVATAAIILVLLVSIAVTGTLEGVGVNRSIYALAPTILTLEMAQRIHHEYSAIMYGVTSATVWGAWAMWTFGGFAIAWIRLQRLPVTR
ncbi:MAG: ABC transporter permease [Acidimicrobiales bacterium]